MVRALVDWSHFKKWDQSRSFEILVGPFTEELFVEKRPGLAGSSIYRRSIIMRKNKNIQSIIRVKMAIICKSQGVHIPRTPTHINSKFIYVISY